jgi:Ca2+-binding RTX toxin-like protein
LRLTAAACDPPGDDDINDAEGNDTISGGAGDDEIIDTHGVDAISGDAGNDIIYSTDETKDTISCGARTDSYRTDSNDTRSGRETVF